MVRQERVWITHASWVDTLVGPTVAFRRVTALPHDGCGVSVYTLLPFSEHTLLLGPGVGTDIATRILDAMDSSFSLRAKTLVQRIDR
jgi:hypothetical protein